MRRRLSGVLEKWMLALDLALAYLHYGIVSFRARGTNRDDGGGVFVTWVFSFLLDEPVALWSHLETQNGNEMGGLVLGSLQPWLRSEEET